MAFKRSLENDERKVGMMSKKAKSLELEIHKACLKGDTDKVVKLINGDLVINVDELDRLQTLFAALNNDDMRSLDELLEIGIDVNIQDEAGVTPLHLAIEKVNVTFVKKLLEDNANVNVPDDDKVTPLLLASKKNCPEIMKALLEHGADLSFMDCYGLAPIHAASREEMFENVKVLLQYGADVNFQSSKLQWTGLHYAAKFGNVKIDGNSPFHVAIEKGYMNIVRLILGFGINLDLNFKNEGEKAALELAFHEGQLDNNY